MKLTLICLGLLSLFALPACYKDSKVAEQLSGRWKLHHAEQTHNGQAQETPYGTSIDVFLVFQSCDLGGRDPRCNGSEQYERQNVLTNAKAFQYYMQDRGKKIIFDYTDPAHNDINADVVERSKNDFIFKWTVPDANGVTEYRHHFKKI